jgi:hypothetical protein
MTTNISNRRMLIIPALASGGGGGSLTYNYVATVTPNNAGSLNSPVTFTAANIGTPSSDRVVVIAFGNFKVAGSANGDFSSVTIGGVTATKAAGTASSAQRATEIWYAVVPAGTTGNIVVSFVSGWIDSIAPMVGIITGSATASVSSTQTAVPPAYPANSTNSNVGAITVATGGVAVLGGFSDSHTVTASYSGSTTDVAGQDFGAGSGASASTAHAVASATVTETVTGSSGVSGWISASFQP